MEEVEIFVDKKEFLILLRTEFIPSLVEEGHKDFILLNQKDMFSKWTCFFYKIDGVYKIVNLK